MKANTYDAKVNNNINVATDFGGKLAENAVKETVTELDSVPADNKLPKEQSHMTPQRRKYQRISSNYI